MCSQRTKSITPGASLLVQPADRSLKVPSHLLCERVECERRCGRASLRAGGRCATTWCRCGCGCRRGRTNEFANSLLPSLLSVVYVPLIAQGHHTLVSTAWDHFWFWLVVNARFSLYRESTRARNRTRLWLWRTPFVIIDQCDQLIW